MVRMIVALSLVAFPGFAAKNGLDTARIEQLTGLKGKWNEKEGVFKVGIAAQRSGDHRGGRQGHASSGSDRLGGFHQGGAHTVVMGTWC